MRLARTMMHAFHVDVVLRRLTLYQTSHVPMHNRHPAEAKTSTPAREVNSSHEDMSKGNHSPVVVSSTHATWNPAREASLQTVLMQLEPVCPTGHMWPHVWPAVWPPLWSLVSRVASLATSKPCGHLCDQPCCQSCGQPSDQLCGQHCDQQCGQPCGQPRDQLRDQPCFQSCGQPCGQPHPPGQTLRNESDGDSSAVPLLSSASPTTFARELRMHASSRGCSCPNRGSCAGTISGMLVPNHFTVVLF
jgi:hypothetical protein